MLKSGFDLSFGQIGLLTLIFQVTASLLQPMVGLYTDHRPQPYSLPLGMACSLVGLITLGFARTSRGCLPARHCLASAARFFTYPRKVLLLVPLFRSGGRKARARLMSN
jgi:MFS transporter, FSR family, fosmidomycin resistance protein